MPDPKLRYSNSARVNYMRRNVSKGACTECGRKISTLNKHLCENHRQKRTKRRRELYRIRRDALSGKSWRVV